MSSFLMSILRRVKYWMDSSSVPRRWRDNPLKTIQRTSSVDMTVMFANCPSIRALRSFWNYNAPFTRRFWQPLHSQSDTILTLQNDANDLEWQYDFTKLMPSFF